MTERLGRTVTFMFTDIEGSTILLKALGRDLYGELLREQQRVLREIFAAHSGNEIDTQGESFFVAFRSASDAVEAAVAIQRALAAHEWPEEARVRVRIGIHTGEAAAAGEGYVGFSVHRAARVGAVGHGGQVLLSDSTRSLIEDDLPREVFLRDLGRFQLKDVDRPERISQVAAEGLQVDFPQLKATPVKVPALRRRALLIAMLAGVVAAAIAIPVFALSSGSSGSLKSRVSAPVAGNSVGVFELKHDKLTGQVAVQKRPSAVATGLGSVWVANLDDDSVSEINPKTNTVEQTFPVGDGPAAIAVGGGFVWVANSLGGSVSQIDPRVVLPVATIQIGGNPSDVVFGDGAVWVADATDRTVRRIDPVTGKPGPPIQVGAAADAIGYGFGSVWVASQSAGTITRIDPASKNALSINVGNGPSAITVGAGSVWVANSLDGTVSRIDPNSNNQLTMSAGAGPDAVAVAPDGKSVWVANSDGGSLSRIDPGQDRSVQTILTGNHPSGVGVTKDSVYFAVRGTGDPHLGGTLKVAEDGVPQQMGPDLLDPAITYYTLSWQMLTNTNDGLVGFQRASGIAGTRLVPDLAVSLPRPGDHGKTYTFQLRPGIRYSNGALVKPADFRRAIERALTNQNPDGTGPGSGFYSDIVGGAACVKTPKRCDLSKGIVTGSNTVSFHLTAPDPDFLYKLAVPTADAEPADTPLVPRLPLPATGPYEIASMKWVTPKTHLVIRLARNPHFHEWSALAQPSGYPDAIVLDFTTRSGRTDVREVEHGSADLTDISGDVPAALRAQIHTRYSSELQNNPTLSTLDVVLNTRIPPFNNAQARRAFSYAINRNRLASLTGGRDFNEPTCQMLPPGVPGYARYCPFTIRPNSDGRYVGPDLVKARQLVAASGTHGETVVYNVTKSFLNGNPYPPYILSVLQQLGYKARIQVVARNVYDQDFDSRLKWQLVGYLGWYADYPAASDFFTPLTCASFVPASATKNNNFSEFCNHRIDAEIAHAQSLDIANPPAAAAAWAKVDRDVVDQVPWVPTLNPHVLELVSPRVGNYVYSLWLGGALLDQLWVH